jgi:BCD family chlorophyll transporter-like MFS transporter
MWKQEARRPPRGAVREADPSFLESWRQFCAGDGAIRRLIVVGLGTMAFCMSDILLEPFGGQVLGLSVSATTKLTALLAVGGLFGFAVASQVLGQGADPYRVSRMGAYIGVPAFILVIGAAPLNLPALFLVGNFLVGFGGALFGHATLTATMMRAPVKQTGLALGAWGAVQATAAGIGMALSGVIRDLVTLTFEHSAAAGYITVYLIEIALLAVTIIALVPLISQSQRRSLDHRAGAGAANAIGKPASP